jgi:hypothetical protein
VKRRTGQENSPQFVVGSIHHQHDDEREAEQREAEGAVHGAAMISRRSRRANAAPKGHWDGSASRVGGARPLHKDEVTETQPPACEGQPNTDTAEDDRHLG